jgi:hypothetical protein
VAAEEGIALTKFKAAGGGAEPRLTSVGRAAAGVVVVNGGSNSG